MWCEILVLSIISWFSFQWFSLLLLLLWTATLGSLSCFEVKMVRYLRFQFNRFHRGIGSLRFQFNKFHRVLGRANSLDVWPRNNDATPIQTHRFQSVWRHLRGSTGGHQAWKPNLGSMTASRVTRVSRTSKEVWLPKEGGWRATILKVLRSKTRQLLLRPLGSVQRYTTRAANSLRSDLIDCLETPQTYSMANQDWFMCRSLQQHVGVGQ